ncbi:hypothetical protein HK102_004867, partial [Quaeritorhiza haematococci]
VHVVYQNDRVSFPVPKDWTIARLKQHVFELKRDEWFCGIDFVLIREGEKEYSPKCIDDVGGEYEVVFTGESSTSAGLDEFSRSDLTAPRPTAGPSYTLPEPSGHHRTISQQKSETSFQLTAFRGFKRRRRDQEEIALSEDVEIVVAEGLYAKDALPANGFQGRSHLEEQVDGPALADGSARQGLRFAQGLEQNLPELHVVDVDRQDSADRARDKPQGVQTETPTH